jgi:hypothetical protein
MRSKRKRELERILDQYDLDHAEQGGLAGIALELFRTGECEIAGHIADRLFADLPDVDRHAIGDMLDRDLDGAGRWLLPLVTEGYLAPVRVHWK